MTPSQAAQEKPTSPRTDLAHWITFELWDAGHFTADHEPHDPGFEEARSVVASMLREAAAATPSLPPDWCGLIGSFMGVEQYCGEPSASAWHQPGEWFKHEFVPLTLTPHRMKEADDAE